jgi:hypothetical protein
MTEENVMEPKEVLQYLQDNPQFFEKYADTLANINIPHPHNGKVIPISERQIVTLRDKNQTLQKKLLELISFGEENDAIGEKMHHFSVALLTFNSLDELLHGINVNLREDFAVPHTAIRLWDISSHELTSVEFTETSDDIHAIADSLTQPYCGPHIADEIKHWFGSDADQLQSFAMIPLRLTQTIGLLALGTPEPQRFYPGMGTLHLKRLGELVSTALSRYSPEGNQSG